MQKHVKYKHACLDTKNTVLVVKISLIKKEINKRLIKYITNINDSVEIIPVSRVVKFFLSCRQTAHDAAYDLLKKVQ